MRKRILAACREFIGFGRGQQLFDGELLAMTHYGLVLQCYFSDSNYRCQVAKDQRKDAHG